MGMFDGIENAATGEANVPFLGLGRYRVRIDEVVMKKSLKGGGSFLKATFNVLTSDGPNANAAGSTAAYLLLEDKSGFNYHLRDGKAFFAAVMNEPAEKVTGAVIQEAVSPDQPCKGVEILVEAFPHYSGKKRKDGTDLIVYRFSPVETPKTETPSAAVIDASKGATTTKASGKAK